MAGEIIKVYNTKDNAMAGGSTGLVTNATIDSNGGAYYNNAVPYFTYREYWYRIEANDVIMSIIIDWDDGEDNSPERANLEIIEPVGSVNYAITSHIYTKHGVFWPLIRVVSKDGYYSKWYTNDANPDYAKLSNLTLNTGSSQTPAGANSYSLIREEKAGSDKIPHFIPANRMPIAVLKSDRKRVYAGIDNDLISGTLPLLYAYTDSTVASRPMVTLIAGNEESNQIKEYTDINIQTDTSGGNPYTGISIENETVPKGNVYVAGAKEKTTLTCIADTVQSPPAAGDDGLTTGRSNSSNIGNYFTFTSGSTNYYAWFKQNGTKDVHTISFDALGSGNIKSDLDGVYHRHTDVDGTTTDFWWYSSTFTNTTYPNASQAQADQHVKMSIPGGSFTKANAASQLGNDLYSGAYYVWNGSAYVFQSNTDAYSNVTAYPDGGTSGVLQVSSNVVTATNRTGGHATNMTDNDSDIVTTNTTEGKATGTIPSGYESSLSGKTAIEIAYDDGASANTIAQTLRTQLTSTLSSTADISGSGATCVIEEKTVGTRTNSADGTSSSSTESLDLRTGFTIATTTDGSDTSGTIAPVNKLYKVSLQDIDRLNDTDRVYILCHDFNTNGAIPDPDNNNCIAVLSNGNPIVELDDPYTIATLDASESYARSPNVSIESYSYELDKKTITGQIFQDLNASSNNDTLTPVIGRNTNGTYTALNYGDIHKLTQSYTHNNLGMPMDADSRFYNFARLPRVQVEDNSLDTNALPAAVNASGHNIYGAGAGDVNRFSNIPSWTRGDADRQSLETVYLILGTAGSFTKDATVTQDTSGATGKVLRATKNNKWLELYEVTGTFNTSNTITSSNPNDLDTSITPSTVTTHALKQLKEERNTGRAQMMVATASGRTTNAANIVNDTITTNTGFTSTATSITVSDAATWSSTPDGTEEYITFYDTDGEFLDGDGSEITFSEILKVTAGNNTTEVLTVERGAFTTTPQSAQADASTTVSYVRPKYLQLDTTPGTDNILLGGNSTAELTLSDNITDHPENFIITKIPVKYDKLYFRLDNSLLNTSTEPLINITVYYTKKTVTSNVATYTWAPMPIVDYTREFKQSGIIKWDIPDDWASVIPSDLTWNLVGPEATTGGSGRGGEYDPNTIWNTDGYGLIVALTVKADANVRGSNGYINYGGGYNVSGNVITGAADAFTVRSPYTGPDGGGSTAVNGFNDVFQVGDVVELLLMDDTDNNKNITITDVTATTVSTSTTLDDESGTGLQMKIVPDTHEQVKLYNVWPILDDHSELITIEDPHHVSLNSIGIAQSISYNRQGKYMVVEDRLGKSDIRRIGATGGTISFGGIDLGTDDTGRDKILSYQKNGTPVFLDITHGDGDKTRFFGKILSMSEDFATGKMHPKWAVTMQCSHLIELNSTGYMQTGKISLGGVVDDVSKYIL